MKKLKVMTILLFVASAVILGLFMIYQQYTKDVIPPVIRYEQEEIRGSVTITEEDLLADVTATDNKSGDISDKMVIESISSFVEEDTRIVRYAVIDDKGNVARAERNLIYTDYQEPRFSLEKSMRFPMGRVFEPTGFVSAHSELDGDLTEKIKCTVEKTIDLSKTDTYEIEFRVTDTAGEVAYLPLTVEIYDKSLERIEVYLKEYLVYIPKGVAFDPNAYYDSASVDGALPVVQSNVNVNEPGVYTVDYTVQSQGMLGKNRLIVIVTE